MADNKFGPTVPFLSFKDPSEPRLDESYELRNENFWSDVFFFFREYVDYSFSKNPSSTSRRHLNA